MACCWAADRVSACLPTQAIRRWTTRAATLRGYQEHGFRLLGLSWQPGIGEGRRSAAEVDALFGRMNDLMGLSMEVEYIYVGESAQDPAFARRLGFTFRSADDFFPGSA
jgi:hypothetical protein